MLTHSVTASRRRFVKEVCSKHLPITSYSKSTSVACHLHTVRATQNSTCVVSLPGYSERLASEKKATHLVQPDLLEHATVRKSRCESTGRCTGRVFARVVGNAILRLRAHCSSIRLRETTISSLEKQWWL